jgi:hypothetical protein
VDRLDVGREEGGRALQPRDDGLEPLRALRGEELPGRRRLVRRRPLEIEAAHLHHLLQRLGALAQRVGHGGQTRAVRRRREAGRARERRQEVGEARAIDGF